MNTNTTNIFPKVLIAAPTSKTKYYAFSDWLSGVMGLSYPADSWKAMLCDNTPDKGLHVIQLNREFQKLYGKNNHQFRAYHIDNGAKKLTERICDATNACRDYAIMKGYDYLLMLESDVVPPPNVIEELMFEDRQVIGALYDRDEGKSRKLMLQRHIKRGPNNIYAYNTEPHEEPGFINGLPREVASVGLGCVLIRIDVLKRIAFRVVAGEAGTPDRFWAEDLFRNKIKVFAHCGVVCQHYNQDWGLLNAKGWQ